MAVRPSQFEASDAFRRFGAVYLPRDVQGLVHQWVQVGRRDLGDLPIEAVCCAAVDLYLCEFDSGGHTHVDGIRENFPELFGRIRAGLVAIGLHYVVEIFDEFEAHMAVHPGADWRDPVLDQLDRKLRVVAPTIYRRHADWLLGLPNLVIVPDADYPKVRQVFVERGLVAQLPS